MIKDVKEVIRLLETTQLSYTEIAHITGVSSKTVHKYSLRCDQDKEIERIRLSIASRISSRVGIKPKTIKLFPYHGEMLNIADIAKATGIRYQTLHMRLKRGWSFENAISKPPKKGKPISEIGIIAKEIGLSVQTVRNRFNLGWTEEQVRKTPVLKRVY